MKTLHRIFHHKIFTNYLKILFVSLALMLIGHFMSDGSAQDSVAGSAKEFINIIEFILPLLTFFLTKSFAGNVKWLINQNFSRLELFKFFIYSQTLKIALCSINYFLLGTLYLYLNGSAFKMTPFLEFDGHYTDYFFYYGFFVFLFYIFYAAPLFQKIQHVNVNVTTNKKVKMKLKTIFVFSCLVCLIATLYLVESIFVSPVLFGFLSVFILSYFTLIAMNHVFKVYDLSNVSKLNTIISCLSLMICLPMLALTFLMRTEVQDENISYNQRARSLVYLGVLNSNISEMEMRNFLKEVKKDLYHDVIQVLGDKVDFSKSLALVINGYQAKGFIDFHSRKYSEEKVQQIVEHMALLMENKKLRFNFAEYSHSFFIKQKVSEQYINELVKDSSSYKQLAAIYFAKKSLSNDVFKEFYTENLVHLKKEVIDSSFARRSIASKKSL